MRKLAAVLIVFLLVACGSNEPRKIPLSEVPEELKKIGTEIANDIFYLTPKPDGMKKFIRKKYITTKVHMNIKAGYYSLTGLLVNEKLGDVSSFELFEVVDKGLVKIFRYRITCSNYNKKFVELRLKINTNKKLADFNIHTPDYKKGLLKVKELPI